MKQILTILFLSITSIAFSQQKFTVKVQGNGSSVDSNFVNEKLAEKQGKILTGYLLNGDTLISADPLAWDSTFREMGNMVYDGNKWIMLYSGNKLPYVGNEVWVGYATSIDKKTWVKQGKITEEPLEDPYLIYHSGTYYLYGEDKSEVPFSGIRLFTSTDFETWTDHGKILDKGDTLSWEEDDVSSPTVLVENDIFYLFYEGRRSEVGNNQPGAVGLATSIDGINFTKYDGNPIITGTGTPLYAPMRGDLKWATHLAPDDIFKIRDEYFITVHAYESNSGQFVAGILSSKDKITWTDYLGSWVSKQDSSEKLGDGLMVQWGGNQFIGYYYDETNTNILSGAFGFKSDYYLGNKPLTTLSTVTIPKYANVGNDPTKVLSTDSVGGFKLVTISAGGSVSNADSLGGEPASNYYLKTAVDAALALKANDNAVLHLAGTETITGVKILTQYIRFSTGNWIIGNSNTFAYKGSSSAGYIGTNTSSSTDSTIGIFSGTTPASYIPLFLRNANASVKTRAYIGQIANIQQWEDVSGNVLSYVDKDGNITASNLYSKTQVDSARNKSRDSVTTLVTSNSVAIEGKADTSRVTQTADYVIEKIGSTIYARPGFKSGLPAYSNASFNTVITSAMGQLVNGGKVLIKKGLYDNLSPINIPFNSIIIEGEGKYNTVLKLKNNADVGIVYGFGLINISNSSISGSPPVNYFTLKNISLDGNGSNQSKIDSGASLIAKGNGIYGEDSVITDITVENCYIHDFTQMAILLNAVNGNIRNCHFKDNYWGHIVLDRYSQFTKINDNYFEGGGNAAISTYGQDIVINDNIIDSVAGMNGTNNSHWGIGVEGGYALRNKIINNTITGVHDGIYLGETSSFCEVSGNTIHDLLLGWGAGIWVLNATSTLVNNNKIYNNIESDGIIISDTSKYTLVQNNDIINSGQGVDVRTTNNTITGNRILDGNIGIHLRSTATDNYVIGNVAEGVNSDNDIVNEGTSNIFKDNFKVKSNAWLSDDIPLNGTAAPTITPSFIGQEFLDITNKKSYKAFGTSSSADWVIVN